MNEFLLLKDHVYNYIVESIRNGTLLPNNKISEQDICDVLNISRTPVREALILLSSDGLLTNHPRKGFVVKGMSIRDAEEIYQVIGALDGLAAMLALDKMKEEHYNKMQFYIKSMYLAIESDSIEMYYSQQEAFHNVYTNICGNNQLIESLDRLGKKFLLKSYNVLMGDNYMEILKDTNKEHEVILDLFKKGDVVELEKYIKMTHWKIAHAKYTVTED